MLLTPDTAIIPINCGLTKDNLNSVAIYFGFFKDNNQGFSGAVTGLKEYEKDHLVLLNVSSSNQLKLVIMYIIQ